MRCLNLAQYMTVAERVKEFFHNEGIHSTTIQVSLVDCDKIVANWFQFKLSDFQPEFVEAAEPTGSISSAEDCMLACPKPKTTDQVKTLYLYYARIYLCICTLCLYLYCKLACPKPKTTDQVKGLHALVLECKFYLWFHCICASQRFHAHMKEFDHLLMIGSQDFYLAGLRCF